MKNIILSIVVIGLAASASFAEKKEKKDISKDMPEAVVSAVKASYPDAVIEDAKIKKHDGKLLYKFEVKKGENEIKLSYDKDGKLVSSKEEIDANTLPDAVKKAVKEKYPKETIKEATRMFKDNKTTYAVEMKSCLLCKELRLTEAGDIVKKH